MFHIDNGPNGLKHMVFNNSSRLNKRMKWYTVIQSIGLVQWYEEQKRYKDMNTWLKFLNQVMEQQTGLFIGESRKQQTCS